MIEFNTKKFISKLVKEENNEAIELVNELLIDGEELLGEFKHGHDVVAFTSKRIVTIRLSGAHGKKQDYTFIPYTKIDAFAVDHAGLLEFIVSSAGTLKFGFKAAEDAKEIANEISKYILA